jgi:hypothetical protein
MHLTGRYPDWWQGKVFPKPVAMWAAGLTGESTCDTVQKMLVGQPERRDAWGTGMIPGDTFDETYLARGIPNALDSIVVKHGVAATSRPAGASSGSSPTRKAGRSGRVRRWTVCGSMKSRHRTSTAKG